MRTAPVCMPGAVFNLTVARAWQQALQYRDVVSSYVLLPEGSLNQQSFKSALLRDTL